MKYRTIILWSFLAGSLISLAGLFMIREQQPEPLHGHRGNDMVGIAYGLAIGFNVVLALCSLPALLAGVETRNHLQLHALLLLGLPLTFTLCSAIWLDVATLLYCLPYLVVSTLLLLIRSRSN